MFKRLIRQCNRAAVLLTAALLVILLHTRGKGLAGSSGSFEDRNRLFEVLRREGVLHPERQLVHLSYVCGLKLTGRTFAVIDVRELVRGATTPRGVNTIVVLDPTLKPVQRIDYATERPLFCLENRLYVFGDLMMDNRLPEGNLLTFLEGGRRVEVTQVDMNALPLPVTGNRKQPPQ